MMSDPVNWFFFGFCLAFLIGSMVITRSASRHFLRISSAFLQGIPEIIRTMEDMKRIEPHHEEELEIGISELRGFQRDLEKLQKMAPYSLIFVRRRKD